MTPIRKPRGRESPDLSMGDDSIGTEKTFVAHTI